MKTTIYAALGVIIAGCVNATVYQANGIRIGEVDQDSAIVWTRLTRTAELNRNGAAFVAPKKKKKKSGGSKLLSMAQQLPEGKTLDDMEGAVPGAPGEVRLSWGSKGGPEGSGSKQKTFSRSEVEIPTVRDSGWKPVDPAKDFTRQFRLENLKPATEYALKIESRDAAGKTGQTLTGKFRTAPAAGTVAPVTFTVVTGQDYNRRDDPVNGHKIYPHMLALNPDFFIHTGDIEYYDKPDPYATCVELARFKWNRIYGLPNQIEFHRNVASYFIKDDHDTLKNDAWPGQTYGDLTWRQGLDIFREQFPVRHPNYRTIRWGKDLQIWLVEGRDFRSPNNMPDGPDKSIWGKKQKDWFFRTVKESDATFRVLISPTPIVGPDRGNKNDNHANIGFKHEGDELRKFIASQKNMFTACGDRHWQYVSVDQTFGVKEFSCGPTSNKHAGGWSNDKVLPEHRYLNVQGGFLAITVDRQGGKPVLTARHYNVDGKVCNEDVNPAK